MNIAEILKDCPEGIKLYSPIFGEVKFIEVNPDVEPDYPIKVVDSENECRVFNSEGRLYNDYIDSEGVLFPSKDNRDWSTFKAPKKEYKFKPFDKVLVRDDINDSWCCNIFSNINDSGDWKYDCITDIFRYCIPYEGNEHLLGTTNNPE